MTQMRMSKVRYNMMRCNIRDMHLFNMMYSFLTSSVVHCSILFVTYLDDVFLPTGQLGSQDPRIVCQWKNRIKGERNELSTSLHTDLKVTS